VQQTSVESERHASQWISRSRFFLTEAGGLRAERSAPRHTRSFGQVRL